MVGIDIRVDHPRAGGFLEPGFNGNVTGAYGEPQLWITSSEGFRYRSELGVDARVPTILSLGDSFAAGYRVGQDQTYSALLEESLRNAGIESQIPIAMIEEPTSGLYYFQAYGTSLKPKMLLFGITLGNDITQTLYYSRKKYRINESTGEVSPVDFVFSDFWRDELSNYEIPASCLVGRTVPAAPPEQRTETRSVLLNKALQLFSAYRGEAIASYLSSNEVKRPLFDASAGLGHFLKAPPPIIDESFEQLFKVLAALKKQADKNNVQLMVLLFPQRYQVQPADWAETTKAYRLEPTCFDLEAPNKKILNLCTTANIHCIDLLEPLRAWHAATRRTLYFPNGDMHWNQEGHRAVARALHSEVIARRKNKYP